MVDSKFIENSCNMYIRTNHTLPFKMGVEEILKLSTGKNVPYISFTDKNTINAYRDLQDLGQEKINSLNPDVKIIPGVELNVSYTDPKTKELRYIDVIPYNFTPKQFDSIENWLHENINEDGPTPSLEDVTDFFHNLGCKICLPHSRSYYQPIHDDDNKMLSQDFVNNLLTYSNDRKVGYGKLFDVIECISEDSHMSTIIDCFNDSRRFNLHCSGGTFPCDKSRLNPVINLKCTNYLGVPIPTYLVEDWAKPLNLKDLDVLKDTNSKEEFSR